MNAGSKQPTPSRSRFGFVLTLHRGGREAIEFIPVYLNGGPTGALPHICNAQIFRQPQCSCSEILIDVIGIKSESPWLSEGAKSGQQFLSAEKLLWMVENSTVDV